MNVKCWALFGCVAVHGILMFAGATHAEEPTFQIGRSVQDITGPPVGVQMLGFVRADQISAGLHTRQWARAFVIENPQTDHRVAIVVIDLAFPSHSLKLEVLDRLKKQLGDRYREDNVIITATHTHGVPGEFHQYVTAGPLESRFCRPYFNALAEGIAEAIAAADADRQPAHIHIAQGEVEDAGANRSMPAYENNPEEERARYPHPTDRMMTLLKFRSKAGDLGLLNWFAVHPTSMTYYNKLISGDNKGYAAWRMERDRGTTYSRADDFVAAFAQTNCGDVSPNLNLNNTGPGKDETESTQIIGDRQVSVAEKLFDQATMTLSGDVDSRLTYVDFASLVVTDEFTGAGDQPLWPSAFGYAFAAGSTEDGGGHPLFKEGMTEQSPLIDNIIRLAVKPPVPSDEFRQGQRPKVILLAPGLYRPPIQDQVLPLGLVRIGPLTLVVGPCEYTTMAGRRIREAVARELDVDPKFVVIVGYSNNFAGYVTTREEYDRQQYEGGHTLFGPWTEAGHRQEFVKLARAMKSGQPVTAEVRPYDIRTMFEDDWSEGPVEVEPEDAQIGDAITQPAEKVHRGETATAVFWTGNPSNDYRRDENYLLVERQSDPPNDWDVVRTDADWDTVVEYKKPVIEVAEDSKKPPTPLDSLKLAPEPRVFTPEPYQATAHWHVGPNAPAGVYRLVLIAKKKTNDETVRMRAVSRAFEVLP